MQRIKAALYWSPVWLGADSSEYSAWASLFIGPWYVAGAAISTLVTRLGNTHSGVRITYERHRSRSRITAELGEECHLFCNTDGKIPPFEAYNRMDFQQRSSRLYSTDPQRPFRATVSAHPSGGWATIVSLGDGATLTKVFDSEPEALRYSDELADWLAQRPSE